MNCVKKIITEMAVFTIEDGALRLDEVMPGFTVADIKNSTEANFVIPNP